VTIRARLWLWRTRWTSTAISATRLGLAYALVELGAVRRQSDDLRSAVQAVEESLAIFRDLADQRGEAGALNEAGTLYRLNGDLSRSIACHTQALSLARQISSPWDEAYAMAGLGRCALTAGNTPRRSHVCSKRRLFFSTSVHCTRCFRSLRRTGGNHRAGIDRPGTAAVGSMTRLPFPRGALAGPPRSERSPHVKPGGPIRPQLDDLFAPARPLTLATLPRQVRQGSGARPQRPRTGVRGRAAARIDGLWLQQLRHLVIVEAGAAQPGLDHCWASVAARAVPVRVRRIR